MFLKLLTVLVAVDTFDPRLEFPPAVSINSRSKCGVLFAIITVDNDKTICALFINNIANCNNASCIITVKAFDMNFFIYPLKAPPSEFNKPMQAIGIAKRNINISIPLVKVWKYIKTI